MPNDTFFVHFLKASDVLKKTLKVINEAYAEHPVFMISVHTNVTAIKLSIGSAYQVHQNNRPANTPIGNHTELINDDRVKEFINLLNQNSVIQVNSITVDAANPTNHQKNGFTFSPSAGHDNKPDGLGFQIKLENPNQHPNKEFSIALLNSIHKNFSPISKFQIKSDYLSSFEKELLSIRENNLERLEKSTQTLIENISNQTTNWNDFIHKITEEQQIKYTSREEELNTKYVDKETKLNSERSDFEVERKKFEDRARTHVRRDLLEKIKDIITQNQSVSLSDSTINKRSIITKTCISVITVSSIVVLTSVFTFLYNYYIKSNIQTTLLIPSTIGTLFLVSTIIYFLKWNNNWLQVHVNTELYNKKFETDILRASWIIEMFFEWKEEKEQPFPEQLITSFTKNLFENFNENSSVEHPLEQFMKSVNKFNKFKLGKGLLELEKTSKDIKQNSSNS